VDDGILSASSRKHLQEVLDLLTSKFKVKIDFEFKTYLKLNMSKIGNFVYLDQASYITEVATKFKVINAAPVSTPMEVGFQAKSQDYDKPLPSSTPYRELMGCLLYISRQTRPDVLYPVNLLCQFLANPYVKHWNAAKRVLVYLYHSRHFSLRIGPSDSSGLKAYSDSTWADDPNTRLSRSGGVLFYNGSFINAYSHPQRSVSLSSTQAEYQALSSAVQEIIFFRQLLVELGFPQSIPTPLFCDNQGALFLIVSTKNHPKVKHISIKYHFVRQALQEKLISVHYVPTQDQLADAFTKPLPNPAFTNFRKSLGIQAWGGDKI
jgi:hypothetical protein